MSSNVILDVKMNNKDISTFYFLRFWGQKDLIKCLSVKYLIIHYDPLFAPGLWEFVGAIILLASGGSIYRFRAGSPEPYSLYWKSWLQNNWYTFGNSITSSSLSFLIYSLRILITLHMVLIQINWIYIYKITEYVVFLRQIVKLFMLDWLTFSLAVDIQ